MALWAGLTAGVSVGVRFRRRGRSRCVTRSAGARSTSRAPRAGATPRMICRAILRPAATRTTRRCASRWIRASSSSRCSSGCAPRWTSSTRDQGRRWRLRRGAVRHAPRRSVEQESVESSYRVRGGTEQKSTLSRSARSSRSTSSGSSTRSAGAGLGGGRTAPPAGHLKDPSAVPVDRMGKGRPAVEALGRRSRAHGVR